LPLRFFLLLVRIRENKLSDKEAEFYKQIE
jgi:hypothetical protein